MTFKKESPEDIQKLISENDVALIDVRSPRERADGYIARSNGIDFRSADFEKKLNELDKDKILVLYCRVGGRSASAGQKAESMGFKNVYMIDGGISAWESHGLPIEK